MHERHSRPPFRPAALALFVELEAVPPRRRRARAFKDKEIALAKMLGLDPPWLTGCSVLDRDRSPCWPEGHHSRDRWFRVRTVREALLTASAEAIYRDAIKQTGQ
jgi:hypothetical protein